jgi:hypothetical protein
MFIPGARGPAAHIHDGPPGADRRSARNYRAGTHQTVSDKPSASNSAADSTTGTYRSAGHACTHVYTDNNAHSGVRNRSGQPTRGPRDGDRPNGARRSVLDCIHHACGDVEHCAGADAEDDRIRRHRHMELGYRLEYSFRNRDGVGHLRRRARELPNPNRLAFSGCLETLEIKIKSIQFRDAGSSSHASRRLPIVPDT